MKKQTLLFALFAALFLWLFIGRAQIPPKVNAPAGNFSILNGTLIFSDQQPGATVAARIQNAVNNYVPPITIVVPPGEPGSACDFTGGAVTTTNSSILVMDFRGPGVCYAYKSPTTTNFVQALGISSSGLAAGGGYSDGDYVILPADCMMNMTAGAFAAAGTVAGTNPGPFRTGANNWVLQGVTTAVANSMAVACELSPPTRLTSGKGITVNNLQLFYGVQTTALTSITAPTLSTVTYPATGAAAGVTVAAAGGTLTVTPGTLQLALTTSGQMYSENIALGTPVALNTDLQRLVFEQIFNQSAAAVTTLQIGGVIVHYTASPI